MAEQGKKKRASADKSDEPTSSVNPAPVYVGGETIAERLLPHVKKILIGVGVLAIVITVFFTVRYYKHRAAERNTEAVVNAVTEQRREIKTDDAVDNDGGVEEITYASREERAEAALAALAKAKDGPREGVAMLEADDLLEAGRLDEAEAAYRKLGGKPGLEGVLGREGLGFVAEARAQAATGAERDAALAAALEAFTAEQTDDAGPRRAYALYHQARIQAQLGKKDDARTSFEAALDKAKEGGDPVLEDLIDARLTQLDAPPLAAVVPVPKAPDPAAPPPEKPNP